MNERWVLTYEGFEPQKEGLREALCTLGNGVFCTRGAAEEASAGDVHYPGTYLSGGYNRLTSHIAGRAIYNEDLVNFPNWTCLNFRPEDGDWVSFAELDLLSYRQQLRLREGVLARRYRIRDRQGRETTVQSRRFVHMARPHVAAIEYIITPENWSGRLHLRSLLDGSVENTGVPRYRQLASKHLRVVEKGEAEPEGVYLLVQTVQSRLYVAEAATTRLFRDGERVDVEVRTIEQDEVIGEELIAPAQQGKPLKVEKLVAFYTSRDRAITECSHDARRCADRFRGFEKLLRTHRQAWESLWRRCDVQLASEKDPDAAPRREQLIVRLHIFHLLQTVSPNSIGMDVGSPVRGLHGEAYRGNIQWDDLFIHPFYNMRFPELTRTLLMYRYRRLEAARAYARQSGYAGAMFPWQSGSTGEEETQLIHLNPRSGEWDPDHSHLQRHVTAAIAYDVWQYYRHTGDRGFMERYGAELMLEIARFWSSTAAFNPETGRYDICGVMGPDEYHERHPGAEEGGFRNNAYTNVMAVWCIQRGLEVLRMLRAERREELRERLDLKQDELERWRKLTRKMTIPLHGDGIISQFEGFDELEEFDWEGYRKKYGKIARLDRILKAEGKSPDRYKLAKQADVVMLFYLLTPRELGELFGQLGYPFEDETIRKNVDYYMRCTSHGSTLSKMVFASVLDRIEPGKGWEFYREALESDLTDVQGGTTPEGIHLGLMAGTVSMLLRHYAGIDLTPEAIVINPRLPEQLPGIHARFNYRGKWLELDLSRTGLRLKLEKDAEEPVTVLFREAETTLDPGSTSQFEL